MLTTGVSPDDFQSANVVACLSHKPGTEVKSLTCNFETDAGEHVTVDYYSVQCDIELREARTGKHIEQLGAVDVPQPAARSSYGLRSAIRRCTRNQNLRPSPSSLNSRTGD